MSIFTPTNNWVDIQERTIDPQSKYDSDVINQITAVGGGDRYKVTGLLADLVYDTDDGLPYLHITPGIAVKDYVVLQFTDEMYVPFSEPWPTTQGIYYLAIYYKYEKQSPPPVAEFRFIPESEYDPDLYFPLYKIIIDGPTFPDDVILEQLEFGKGEEREYVFIERMPNEYSFVANGGETEIDVSMYYNNYTKEYAVYINGIYQRENYDYTVDHDRKKIILMEPLETNDAFVFLAKQWGRPNSNIPADFYSQEELNNGALDGRYYTETEIDNFFAGEIDGKKLLDWQNVVNTPTTLAGYGITDALNNANLMEHEEKTSNVHGIYDTSDLAYKSGSINQFSDLNSSGADIDDAVSKRHDQNTDTGTSSETFQIGTDGALLKNYSGILHVRTPNDSNDGTLETGTLLISGTSLILNADTSEMPTENAIIEVQRGYSTNSRIIWDENTVTWRAGFAGEEKTIVREGDPIYLEGDVTGYGTFNSDGVAIIQTEGGAGEVLFEDLFYTSLLNSKPFESCFYDKFLEYDLTSVQGTLTFDRKNHKYIIAETATTPVILETGDVIDGTDTYYRFYIHVEGTTIPTIEYTTDSGTTWTSCNADEIVLVKDGFTKLGFRFTFTSDGDFESFGVLYNYGFASISNTRMFETWVADQNYTAPTTVTLPNGATYTTDGKSLEIYLNRFRLIPNIDYIEIDNRSVQFNVDLNQNDVVVFIEQYGYMDTSVQNQSRLDYEHNEIGQHIFHDIVTGKPYRLVVENGNLVLIEQ